jgi:hypothetical protein
MRLRRIALIGSLLAFGLTLSACESMDPTDWFTAKKPLPGDRKEMFPGGVPGVPQGVPGELVEGYKPPPDQPPPQVAEEKPKPKPKPKPAPKTAAAPAAPKPVPAARAQTSGGQSAGGSGGQAPWPDAQPAQPAPAQSQSVFPDPQRR